MTRLLIGNDFSENVRSDRTWTDFWVQRIIWFARSGDVVVLPTEPQDGFRDYVTSLLGIDRTSLRFVVPPPGPGEAGKTMLTAPRLADEGFLDAVREALGGRPVEDVVALWPDASVARLARRLGAEKAMRGFGFIEQGGGVLVNSKSAFRAVAGGVGLPVPPGGVGSSPAEVEELAAEALEAGLPLMLKKDYLSSGHGNEILSPIPGLPAIGAKRVVTVPDRAALRSYLEERWAWLSAENGHIVVERYYPGSIAVFAEFEITDEDVEFGGEGLMQCPPLEIMEIMPTPGLEPDVRSRLIEGGRRLCEALRALGYRGTLSADAIVTADREVLFTEHNGRVTGSTHIYEIIGKRLAGPDYARDRVLMERSWPEDWSVSSFEEAVARLAEAGLLYDPAERAGVVIGSAYDEVAKEIGHVIIAEDLDNAHALQRRVGEVFGDVGH